MLGTSKRPSGINMMKVLDLELSNIQFNLKN
jgi:hypothetical protein